MKNLQTRFLKFTLYFTLFFCFQLVQAQSDKIKAADSLFRSKQYTQSLDLYQSIFNNKEYSPSMLLKMAYIQEGLGKIGLTLYYLKLYHLASNDEQALNKMEELAGKFKLTGYESNDASRMQLMFNKNRMNLQIGLLCVLLIVSVMYYWQRSKDKKPWAVSFIIFFVAATILYLNNSSSFKSVIVKNDRTYLMAGPSAGASVLSVMGEGNQLEALEQTDVWLKVKWLDKIAYVKTNSILTVAL
jgi:hypothetical protein